MRRVSAPAAPAVLSRSLSGRASHCGSARPSLVSSSARALVRVLPDPLADLVVPFPSPPIILPSSLPEPRPSSLLAEVLAPLDAEDARHAPDSAHHLPEVREVLDLDDEGSGHPPLIALDLR